MRHAHVRAALPRLRRHAFILSGDRITADASVMDCLKAYRKNPDRVRPDAIAVDLFRLLHDSMAERVGQAVAYSRRMAAAPVPAVAGADHGPERQEPDRAPGMDVRSAERLPEILGRFHALPPTHRQVLTLVSVEGLSVEECSEVLDLPSQRIGVLLAEARRTLAALQIRP